MMAGTVGRGGGVSTEGNSSAQPCESGEALTEWRSSEQLENGTPSTSPPYWDSDDEDDPGPKPSNLYGKYTWKIDKFPQINKRELRSNAFEVGGYKWYILIYPQGCDVCNHLSLFLCVANHDKLLPGWSHFAQFTISVAHKDQKKSKYSDTLHRFWKKEHDWGWKKFMELSKVSDGFLENDTLIIKAQVQVIREKVNRPFRCLDCNYRRELVRVYLTNVEQVCRRFVEERRTKLVKLLEDGARWSSFCTFWQQIEESARQWMSREKSDIILKIAVKHFFIEKEVTSTLVMDSLYSGLKALEGQSSSKKGSVIASKLDGTPAPIVRVEKDMFVLVEDVLPLLERAAMEPLPPKDEKGPQNRTKDGGSGDDFSKDTIERDERRLTELGRRTVEIFILDYIFSNKIEIAYQEAVALRRQEDLIREEAESEKKTKLRSLSEKEKKSKKKQAKQKRSNRKAKDKVRDGKLSGELEAEEILANEMTEIVTDVALPADENTGGLDEKSDISDSVDFVGGEALHSDSEDRDASPINWDTDTSDNHPATEAHGGSFSLPNGRNNRKSPPRIDDSSSTCSADSIPSIVMNCFFKGNSFPQYKETSLGRKMNLQNKTGILEGACREDGLNSEPAGPCIETVFLNNGGSCKITTPAALESGLSYQDLKNLPVQQTIKEDTVSLPNKTFMKETSTVVPAAPSSPQKSSSIPQIKLVAQKNSVLDSTTGRKKLSLTAVPNGQSISPASALPNKATPRPERQLVTAPKLAEKSAVHQMPVLSRPSSAPIVPAHLPVTPAGLTDKATPNLARSASVASRLGQDSLSSSAHSFIPQSYRNVMMGNTESASSSSFTNASSAAVSSSPEYTNPSNSSPSSTVKSVGLNSIDQRAVSSWFTGTGSPGLFNSGNQWMESSQRDAITRNTYAESSSLADEMQNLNLHNFLRSGSLEYIPAEFQPRLSALQVQCPPADEFPHIDIINDLFEDEFTTRNTATSSGSLHSFTNGNSDNGFNQLFNRQLSFPGEMNLSGGFGSSTSSPRLGRTQSYQDNGLHQNYNSYNSHYDPTRDLMPQGSGAMNFHSDGYLPTQWQLPNSDSLSPLSMQNTDNNGYSYRLPDYSSSMGGANGYGMFRPANGR